jgi:mRNA-degrading endonuclease RelE of RelBE toxin-antitoxin system
MYEIEFSEDAVRHLRGVSARDRSVLLDAVEDQLGRQPDVPTRHRKLLRGNPLAAWELRVGEYRVFYNLPDGDATVVVVAIGRKAHNRLTIEGEEFEQ